MNVTAVREAAREAVRKRLREKSAGKLEVCEGNEIVIDELFDPRKVMVCRFLGGMGG